MDDLGERLARLEDERAIVTTLYRYGDALDHGDREEFLDCFTLDAEYVVRMRIDPSHDLSYRGHEQLGTYFDGHTHAPAAFHKHVTVNPLIVLHGLAADVQSYFLRVDSLRAGPAVVVAAGRYIDRLTRGFDGGWRIQSRSCEVENL